MNGATEFQKLVESDNTLEIVSTDIWWILIVRHKESGRRVRLRYNSLWIEYWFEGTDDGIVAGTNNMLRFDKDEVLKYLKG